ncbi:MAG: hypothetical protein H6641_08030 [Caldilineaceae bacterium]|nr:hypothetical protein [Caldilineaceae bacterium]
MSLSTTDYAEMKSALKEALVELIQERRELFHELLKEVAEEAISIEERIPSVLPQAGRFLDEEFEKAVDREISAFHKMHAALMAQHVGEYVAIYGEQLIDHDADKLALYQRVEKAYPQQFVLMRRVEKEPERELLFRSTRYFVKES